MTGKKLENQKTIGSLFSRFYEDLRRIAHARMTREPRDLTIQPTGLVHAVYERLHRSPPNAVPDTKRFWVKPILS